MRLCPLEILALGMRMASGDKTSLPDELFTHGGIEGLFGSKAAVIEWLERLGVKWDGDPKTVIQSVSKALRTRAEYKASHLVLATALQKLEIGFNEPESVGDIVAALLTVKGTE